MLDSSEADALFARLLAALSRRTASPLEAPDGLLVLLDGTDTVQLVVELSMAGDHVFLVARILPIPQQDAGGTLALRLLRLNADRPALGGAVIAVDGLRRQFVLIQQLPLDLEPEAFVDGVEAVLDLAAAVRADVAGDVRPPRGTAALFLRTGRAA
ncbi:type III secretion system chaperone [Roseateles sp. UC29_93]|uniref:type III secretion system chaperone n=1 Tax=Roseateles sp. UC29_93 TaxID=3350177 RepID=UPI00366C4580